MGSNLSLVHIKYVRQVLKELTCKADSETGTHTAEMLRQTADTQ